MKLQKTYRYRLSPDEEQLNSLNRFGGARRFVYNWALARTTAHYHEQGCSLSFKDLSRELTALKKQAETSWLKEIDSQLPQQALADLKLAYRAFFEHRSGFPHFKKKGRDPERFRIPQRVDLDFAGRGLKIPKIGWVSLLEDKKSKHCPGPGMTIKGARFKRSARGHWYVSLVCEFKMPDTPLAKISPRRVAAVDLGLKTLATIFHGSGASESIANPRFIRQADRKLRRAHKNLSRKQPGSANRAKARITLAALYERVANQRGDYLHKLTSDLIGRDDLEALVLEDLSVKGMSRGLNLGKSVLDAALGEFRRQCQYKALWARKRVVIVDRFFPSSQLCSTPACDYRHSALKLKERAWDCPECGAHHDRDLNAAINLHQEGLRLLLLEGSLDVAAGRAETAGLGRASARKPVQMLAERCEVRAVNACGADVRPTESTKSADGATARPRREKKQEPQPARAGTQSIALAL